MTMRAELTAANRWLDEHPDALSADIFSAGAAWQASQIQSAGEVVGWEYFADGRWYRGVDNDRQSVERFGYPTRTIFAALPMPVVPEEWRDAIEQAADALEDNYCLESAHQLRVILAKSTA